MSLVSSIAGMSQACEKMTADEDYKIGRFQLFCYRYFLYNTESQKRRIKHVDGEILETLISHAQDKDLKKKAYEILRDRAISDKSLPRSIIVNEIIAACGLISGIKQYMRITLKMMRDT
jgi:hypothetical protein